MQKFNRREKEPLHKINNAITAEQVRVVGEDIEQGVYPLAKAIELAFKAGLDLVEISPNAEPPVCKIVDYKKFLYEQKKKQKEIKYGVMYSSVAVPSCTKNVEKSC